MIVAALAVLLFPGCTSSFSEGELRDISLAYSEMLIAKNMGGSDSTLTRKLVDSTLREHGIAGEGEMVETMKKLAREPESLRAVLDSAQRRLERIQQGNIGLPPDSSGVAQ